MKVLQLFLAAFLVSSSYGKKMVMPRLPVEVLLKGDWPMVDSSRIVGGSQAYQGEFPYQISLQRSGILSYSHSCGGSIYSNMTILNAAHCVNGVSPGNLRVVAGDYNLNGNSNTRQVRSVASFKMHPSYDDSTFQNDIALIRLSSALTFNGYVVPIQLPYQGSRPSDATLCTVTGWGTMSESSSSIPAILNKVDVPIVSDTACKASYGSYSIKSGMMCAGYQQGGYDSCQGDSGGPLVEKGTRMQVGIVSWGNGCAQPYYYGVYTQVGYYTNWIIDNGANDRVPSSILLTVVCLIMSILAIVKH